MEEIRPTPERVATNFAGYCWPRPLTDSWGTWCKSYALLAASYLTDPICRVREISWEQGSSWLLQVEKITCAALALFTTVPGIAIRSLVRCLQQEPYIHLQGSDVPKSLIGREIVLYTRNLANIAGGYSITDGGVAPWKYRIDAQVEELINQKADILCLSELMDPSASFYLYEKLKGEGYVDFYFNPGVKAIAPGAGLFVASKYKIQNLQFKLFPAVTLQDRTKWTCKGFFRFDVVSEEDVIARIYTTHLQHSEQPAYPKRNPQITEITQAVVEKALKEDCLDDVVARAAQMHLIVQAMLQETPLSKPTILTGDLNLDDAEKDKSLWKEHFDVGALDYKEKQTWGGDKWCVDLVNGSTGTKTVSGPLNLDHTLLLKGGGATLCTELIDSCFDGTKYDPHALSDHGGLRSTITLAKSG